MLIIKKITLSVLLIVSCDVWSSEPREVEETSTKPLLERLEKTPWQRYLEILSSGQSTVGKYIQSTGEEIDLFFGDEQLDVTTPSNSLKVYMPVTVYDHRKPVTDLNFKLQIDLPRTSKRWKLFISSFDENSNRQQNSDYIAEPAVTREASNDSENRVGGRYLLLDQPNHIAQFDLGLKFENYVEPNPFVRFRDRLKFQLGEGLESRTTNTLYLEKEDGFGWQGEQVFDQVLDTSSLLRSQTNLYWWQEDEAFLIKQRFTHFQKVNAFRAKAYFWETLWQDENRELELSSTLIGVNLRERLYRDWLFAEVEPRVTWYYQDASFEKPNYSLMLMLEMHFYKPK